MLLRRVGEELDVDCGAGLDYVALLETLMADTDGYRAVIHFHHLLYLCARHLKVA
jgi:hypothetical protein